MTMLKINELAVDVANTQLRKSIEEIGSDDDRSPAGYFLKDGRIIKRIWDVVTVPMLPTDSEQLERWITGRGMWNIGFETGYASPNGLNVNGGFGGVLSTPSAKFGTRYWFGSFSTDTFTYRFPVLTRGSDWTVSVWHRTAATWNHCVMSSVGGVVSTYMNGAVTANSLGFISVSNPQASVIAAALSGRGLTGTSVANVSLDDLVVCNWPWSLDMAAAVYAMSNNPLGARPFSDAPKMEMSGDLLDQSTPINVLGSVSDESYTQGYIGGVHYNNLRILSFKLEEV